MKKNDPIFLEITKNNDIDKLADEVDELLKSAFDAID